VSRIDLCTAKIPFIHLLATKPLTPSRIRYRLCLPKFECDQLLAIFARDLSPDPDKKELQEISCKELDVRGFPYHMQSVRQAAIDRSIEAFDILQIDQDNLWQVLLPAKQWMAHLSFEEEFGLILASTDESLTISRTWCYTRRFTTQNLGNFSNTFMPQ
jgi:hypothetical protein